MSQALEQALAAVSEYEHLVLTNEQGRTVVAGYIGAGDEFISGLPGRVATIAHVNLRSVPSDTCECGHHVHEHFRDGCYYDNCSCAHSGDWLRSRKGSVIVPTLRSIQQGRYRNKWGQIVIGMDLVFSAIESARLLEWLELVEARRKPVRFESYPRDRLSPLAARD